jgi:hypothetical protein
MNLLREYIRELLTESVDPKIMEIIDRLEENGWKIKLTNDRAILIDPVAVKVHGSIRWDTHDEYEAEGYGWCHGANLVGSSNAASGFGPILYDVAIEVSGDSGLMSDRYSVSPDATGIWDYYMRNRSDVQVKQLDNKENILTPRDYDNCNQDVSTLDVGTKIKHGWAESSLSKVYYKYGTPVMDELERRGLLVGRK